jgi:SPP1 family phage portal protein
MDPFTATQTETLSKQIEDDAPKTTDIIKHYIDEHQIKIPSIVRGVEYYLGGSDITKRQIYIYNDAGAKVPDIEATNNKIPSGWHKLLVDQKVSYLAGDPITIASKSEKKIEPIQEVLGEEFDDVLPELVKNASNKGEEWLHPYVDEEGNFDYIVIPREEFIPIYDNKKRKHLSAGIRLIELDDETTKVELWDSERVTFYEMVNGKLYLDQTEEVNPQSHFYLGDKGYGWGKVPFVGFDNNQEKVSDLVFYKALIDAYDLMRSDIANTLEDIQSIIYALKGYEGQSLGEFMSNLKRYKAISLSDEPGSGVDTIRAEVPVEATEAHLNRLREEIYAFGQGVNSSPDKFGNAPTGVAIKNLYSLLDMKASVLERKFSKGLEKFIWFVCEYLSISGKGDFDYKDITFTFNKTIMVNETELLDNLTKSGASIETKLEHDPFVTDVDKELKRLEKERELELDAYNSQLGKVGQNSSLTSSDAKKSDGKTTCPDCGGNGKRPSDKTGESIICRTCGGDGVVS